MLKVFVSGSSKSDLASHYIRRLRAERVVVTLDWPSIMTAVRVPDHDLPEHERVFYSDMNIRAIKEADVFWLLIPSELAPSIGAWFECGYAVTVGKRVVVSGKLTSTIFTAQAHQQYATHDEAYASILDLAARSGPHDSAACGGETIASSIDVDVPSRPRSA